jgi:hypothetical protein
VITPAVSDAGEAAAVSAAAAVPHQPSPVDKMELLWPASVPGLQQLQQVIVETGAEVSLARDAQHAVTSVSALKAMVRQAGGHQCRPWSPCWSPWACSLLGLPSDDFSSVSPWPSKRTQALLDTVPQEAMVVVLRGMPPAGRAAMGSLAAWLLSLRCDPDEPEQREFDLVEVVHVMAAGAGSAQQCTSPVVHQSSSAPVQ